MLFTPTTNILLCNNVSFNSSYEHVRDFSSRQDQQTYFSSRAKYNLSDYNFVRKDTEIKLSINIEDIYDCNYIAYKNKEKWIYCFILEKKYINDNATSIIIKTDVWQTFMFDYTLNSSYVLREHTVPADKTLLTEDIELGDYEIVQNQTIYTKKNNWFIIVGQMERTEKVKGGKMSPTDELIEMVKIPISSNRFSMKIEGIPYSLLFIKADESSVLTYMHNLYNSNCVIGVVRYTGDIGRFATTDVLIPTLNDKGELKYLTFPCISGTTGITGSDIGTFNNPISDIFNCYPFSYSTLIDGENELLIKHELIKSNAVKGKWSFGVNPIERYYLDGYNNDSDGMSYNITNTNVVNAPFCNSNYAEYFLNNMQSIDNTLKREMFNATVSTVVGGATTVGSAMTGNAIGVALGSQSAINSFNGVKSELAKQSDLMKQPASIKNIGKIGHDVAFGSNKVKMITYSIKEPVKAKIRDFWDRYGYKCMRTKIPNINSRSDFNYVKTSSCSIKGNLDVNDIIELKNIFDAGVTIWHIDGGL